MLSSNDSNAIDCSYKSASAYAIRLVFPIMPQPRPGASTSLIERPTSQNVSVDDIYCRELYALGRGTPFRVPDMFPVAQGAVGVLYNGGFKTYFNAYEPCEGAVFTPLPRPPDTEMLIRKCMEPNIYHSSHFGKKEVVGEISMYVDIPA
jgi:hypothetical protein